MNLAKLGTGIRILLSRERSYYYNKPLSATLDLTYRCNLRCQMCEIWKEHAKRQRDELSFSEIESIIDELFDMKISIINLIGGEPLIRKDIIDIIEVVKKRNLFCDLTTNGTLIDEKITNTLVTQKVDHVVISIDAPDERHDKIRRTTGTLEKIKRGIQLINSCKKAHNSDFPRLTINTTVSALNVDLLNKMVPFSEELRVNNLCFTYLNEVRKEVIKRTNEIMEGKTSVENILSSEETSLLLKTEEQIQLLREKIRQIKSQSRDMAVSVRMGLGFCQNDSFLKNGLFPIKKCYMIHNRILIDPYGQVHPCYPLRNYIYGNVKVDRLKDIWNNEKASVIRKKLNNNLLPICYYCGCYFDRNIAPMGFLRWFLKETK